MERRFGVPGTVLDGIFFTEEAPAGLDEVGLIKVEISRQNANLHADKAKMAEQARRMGADAIMGFKYGQRAHKRWQQLFTFKWDTESWYGEGTAVRG